ncbi:hypothetical protein BDW62DRAFT_200800 [Aspergillus aurantiobrunneus]
MTTSMTTLLTSLESTKTTLMLLYQETPQPLQVPHRLPLLTAEPKPTRGRLGEGGTGKHRQFSEKRTLRLDAEEAHGYLRCAIRTATAGLNDVVSAVESIQPNPPVGVAAYLTDSEVLAVVDQAMGPDTLSIIANPTLNIGTINGEAKVNMIDSVVGRYRDAKIELERQEAASSSSSFSPIDHPIVELIKSSVQDVWISPSGNSAYGGHGL